MYISMFSRMQWFSIFFFFLTHYITVKKHKVHSWLVIICLFIENADSVKFTFVAFSQCIFVHIIPIKSIYYKYTGTF